MHLIVRRGRVHARRYMYVGSTTCCCCMSSMCQLFLGGGEDRGYCNHRNSRSLTNGRQENERIEGKTGEKKEKRLKRRCASPSKRDFRDRGKSVFF